MKFSFARLSIVLLTLLPLPAAGDATLVTQTGLSQLAFYPLYSAPATTLSLNDSRIGSEIPGLIRALPVRVGDRVDKGQRLAALDCRSNQILQRQASATLEAARARLTLAQHQLKRSRSLVKEQNIPLETVNQREADLNTAKADLAAGQAALEKTRLDVQRCNISAPFTGIVIERLAGEGEWTAPGQPLLRLLDTQRLEVSAQIPLDRATALQETGKLWLMAAGTRYPLSLRHLLPAIDPRGRYREARLEFTDHPTLPGSSGRLSWRAMRPHLPADIPVRRDGVLGVFLNQDGSARFHPLPGALEGQPAAIELAQDSQIILQGRWGLQDGDPVRTAD